MDEELFLGKGRPLAQLAFRVEPASVDLAGLARLGPPPPVLQDLPKRLGPGIRAAARAALALARGGDSPAERGTTGGDEASVTGLSTSSGVAQRGHDAASALASS